MKPVYLLFFLVFLGCDQGVGTQDSGPTCEPLEVLCGPRPDRWQGQDVGTWTKAAEVWMDCVNGVPR